MEAADIIIVCLSKTSVNKEGYVQRELRIVLDLADYKPEGILFVIPIRLEECEPPRRLRTWQYADYFPESDRDRAYQRLLVSLRMRARHLGIAEVDSAEEIVRRAIEKRARKDKDEKSHKEAEEIVAQDKKADGDETNIQPKEKESEFTLMQIAWQNALKKAMAKKSFGVKNRKSSISTTLRPAHVETTTKEKLTPGGHAIYMFGDTEFVKVPAGKFLIGSSDKDKQAYDDEKPQHIFDISYDYYMARFPITNEQYALYMLAKGMDYFVSGWHDSEKRAHPIVSVSWHDAMEYCRWLNKLLVSELPPNLVSLVPPATLAPEAKRSWIAGVRLPTETEWEKAARGINGLIFPWGDSFDKNKCNADESGKGDTTPVGIYSPQGDSPYGCADMSGNVWEWTHSCFQAYPYSVNDGRESEQGSGDSRNRVQRGGSFRDFVRSARCAVRRSHHISDYGNYGGFRVVIAPPIT